MLTGPPLRSPTRRAPERVDVAGAHHHAQVALAQQPSQHRAAASAKPGSQYTGRPAAASAAASAISRPLTPGMVLGALARRVDVEHDDHVRLGQRLRRTRGRAARVREYRCGWKTATSRSCAQRARRRAASRRSRSGGGRSRRRPARRRAAAPSSWKRRPAPAKARQRPRSRAASAAPARRAASSAPAAFARCGRPAPTARPPGRASESASRPSVSVSSCGVVGDDAAPRAAPAARAVPDHRLGGRRARNSRKTSRSSASEPKRRVVVELDVRQHGDLHAQAEHRAVGLVGLDDQPLARPPLGVGQAAADRPPTSQPGSHARRRAARATSIDAVVVLPCVPATAIVRRSAVSSPSSSARGRSGRPRSRAAAPLEVLGAGPPRSRRARRPRRPARSRRRWPIARLQHAVRRQALQVRRCSRRRSR